MIIGNVFIKYRYLVIFNNRYSGIIKKLNTDKKIPFKLSPKFILTEPPPEKLPLGLRHFLEKQSSKLKSGPYM